MVFRSLIHVETAVLRLVLLVQLSSLARQVPALLLAPAQNTNWLEAHPTVSTSAYWLDGVAVPVKHQVNI